MTTLERVIGILFPLTKIQNSKWLDLWVQHDRERITNLSKTIFLAATGLYLLHIYLDRMIGLTPANTFFWCRILLSCFSFGLYLAVKTKKIFYRRYYRFPLLLGYFTYSIVQTYSMTWNSAVPFYFSLVIPMAILLLAQLGLVTSLILYIVLLAIDSAIIGHQLSPESGIYSMLAVSLGLLGALRSTHSQEIENFIRQQRQLEAEQKLAQIAAQVAHDLRAPLTVLDVLSKHPKPADLDVQAILGEAITRVRDIANDLLVQGRTARMQPCSILKLVESVLAETKTAQSLKFGIKFKLEVTQENLQIQASVVESEFKRVLSIIFNNAVEALDGIGQITVSITRHGSQVKISVADTGKGIPKELLSQIGQKGVSFGKSEGNGLGIHYVITTLKKWGGEFKIESELRHGTQASLILKIVENQWKSFKN